MTGWTPAGVVGRSRACFRARAPTGPSSPAVPDRTLAAGGAWEGSAINYRRDGSEFVMEWSIVSLRARDGAVRHYLAVQRDVTRRVTAEREAIDAMEAAERAERARANLARYFFARVVNLLAARDAPLGPIPRQTVAALFADLVGFTGMAERRSPEEVMQLLRDYYPRRMEAIVFRHEGSLEKYIGDALLAVFGVPDPGPQDATNALRCGHAMLVELRRWNTERTERGEPPIAIGIGLHYGPAVLGDLGGERTMAFAVIGDTINTAAGCSGSPGRCGCDLRGRRGARRRRAKRGGPRGRPRGSAGRARERRGSGFERAGEPGPGVGVPFRVRQARSPWVVGHRDAGQHGRGSRPRPRSGSRRRRARRCFRDDRDQQLVAPQERDRERRIVAGEARIAHIVPMRSCRASFSIDVSCHPVNRSRTRRLPCRARDVELPHPIPQSARVQAEALGRLSASLDRPSAPLEHLDDVGSRDGLEGLDRKARAGVIPGSGPGPEHLVDAKDRPVRQDQSPLDHVL